MARARELRRSVGRSVAGGAAAAAAEGTMRADNPVELIHAAIRNALPADVRIEVRPDRGGGYEVTLRLQTLTVRQLNADVQPYQAARIMQMDYVILASDLRSRLKVQLNALGPLT